MFDEKPVSDFYNFYNRVENFYFTFSVIKMVENVRRGGFQSDTPDTTLPSIHTAFIHFQAFYENKLKMYEVSEYHPKFLVEMLCRT